MPTQLKRATIYLIIAYCLVTFLGFMLTVAFWTLLGLPPDPAGTPAYNVAAYRLTEPFHPLLNLLVFPVFAWLYLRHLLAFGHPSRRGLAAGRSVVRRDRRR